MNPSKSEFAPPITQPEKTPAEGSFEEVLADIQAFQENPEENIERRNRVVERFYRYARQIAYSTARRWNVPNQADDFTQACVEGLMDAVRDYRPERGTFKNYAYHKMRPHLWRTYLDSFTITPKSHDYFFWNQINSTVSKLHLELNRRPTPKEIADSLGKDVFKVQEALIQMGVGIAFSLNESIHDQDGEVGEKGDIFAVSAEASPEQLTIAKDELPQLLADIKLLILAVKSSRATPDEQELFLARYGLDTGTCELIADTELRERFNLKSGDITKKLSNVWRWITVGNKKGANSTRTLDDAGLKARLAALHDLTELSAELGAGE